MGLPPANRLALLVLRKVAAKAPIVLTAQIPARVSPLLRKILKKTGSKGVPVAAHVAVVRDPPFSQLMQVKTELQEQGYGGAPSSLVVSGTPLAGDCVQIDSDKEDPHGERSPDSVSSPVHEPEPDVGLPSVRTGEESDSKVEMGDSSSIASVDPPTVTTDSIPSVKKTSPHRRICEAVEVGLKQGQLVASKMGCSVEEVDVMKWTAEERVRAKNMITRLFGLMSSGGGAKKLQRTQEDNMDADRFVQCLCDTYNRVIKKAGWDSWSPQDVRVRLYRSMNSILSNNKANRANPEEVWSFPTIGEWYRRGADDRIASIQAWAFPSRQQGRLSGLSTSASVGSGGSVSTGSLVREVKLDPKEVKLVPNLSSLGSGSVSGVPLSPKPVGSSGVSQESSGVGSGSSGGSSLLCREGRPLTAAERSSGRVGSSGGGWSSEPKRLRYDDGVARGERGGVSPPVHWSGHHRSGWRPPTYSGQARTELPSGSPQETFVQGPINGDVRPDGQPIVAETVSPSGLACAARVYPDLDGTAVSSWFGCRYVSFPTFFMWLRD